jgi:hypothetical protein
LKNVPMSRRAGQVNRYSGGEDFTLGEMSRPGTAGAQMIQLVHDASELVIFQTHCTAFALDKRFSRSRRDVSMATHHMENIPTIGSEINSRNVAGTDGISPPGGC